MDKLVIHIQFAKGDELTFKNVTEYKEDGKVLFFKQENGMRHYINFNCIDRIDIMEG